MYSERLLALKTLPLLIDMLNRGYIVRTLERVSRSYQEELSKRDDGRLDASALVAAVWSFATAQLLSLGQGLYLPISHFTARALYRSLQLNSS